MGFSAFSFVRLPGSLRHNRGILYAEFSNIVGALGKLGVEKCGKLF
jgi:hypothetical protein